MRELILSIASPETLSWVGFLVLSGGLLGEVAVLLVPTEKHVLHNVLVLFFAAVVLVGYLISHIGDEERAVIAEGTLRTIANPRNINPEQHVRLVNCLKPGAKGPIFIRPGLLNPDAPQLATELGNIFDEAGGFQKREWPDGASLTWSTAGIFLVVIDLHHAPVHATQIQKCFFEAGMTIYGYADPKHPADAVSIGIGPRL